jgi:hypothetical protein
MAIAMPQISPVAHLPVVVGVVCKLQVAARIDTFCAPHPPHVLSCGRGVEALRLAILDGHHALYAVGARLEERGMLPLLQPGLLRASRHADRREQSRDGLFAAHVNRVCGTIALTAQGGRSPPTPLAAPGDDDPALWGVCRGAPPARRTRPAASGLWAQQRWAC